MSISSVLLVAVRLEGLLGLIELRRGALAT
jgi:hypothetical protein